MDKVPFSSKIAFNTVTMTWWRAGRRWASKRSRSATEGSEGVPAAPPKKQQTRHTRSGL